MALMPRRRQNLAERKALLTMRNLMANAGWHSEALLIDAAAEALGGDEAAKLTAQRAYDKHIKTMEPN
jgi:hypothetical protein